MSDKVIVSGGTANDPDNWNQLNETLSQFPGVVERVVRKAVAREAAPIYQTRVLQLPPSQPVQLFDYNATRSRFYVKVVTTGESVYIGDRSSLNSGGFDGFRIDQGDAPIEMRTIAPVFIVATGSVAVTVTVWAEYERE